MTTGKIGVALGLGVLLAGGLIAASHAPVRHASAPFQIQAMAALTPIQDEDQDDDTPQKGDRLQALPGQPLCSNVNELAVYLRVELGLDKSEREFKTCGAMPTGTSYTIVEVSNDNPEIPIRPARIRIVGPGGASIIGWTVLVNDNN